MVFSFKEFITESMSFKDLATWKDNAKKQGLTVKEMTHPSGEGFHFVAKDKEGNSRGTFDPSKRSGTLR